jgi:hypothetical protein
MWWSMLLGVLGTAEMERRLGNILVEDVEGRDV